MKIFALLFTFAVVLSTAAFAQEAAPVAPVSAEAQGFLLNLITDLAVKYPVIATIVGIMGTMRLWAKPVFAGVHAVIQITPTQYDDGLWAKCYGFLTVNPIGRTLAWLLDWVASIKIVAPSAPKLRAES